MGLSAITAHTCRLALTGRSGYEDSVVISQISERVLSEDVFEMKQGPYVNIDQGYDSEDSDSDGDEKEGAIGEDILWKDMNIESIKLSTEDQQDARRILKKLLLQNLFAMEEVILFSWIAMGYSLPGQLPLVILDMLILKQKYLHRLNRYMLKEKEKEM